MKDELANAAMSSGWTSAKTDYWGNLTLAKEILSEVQPFEYEEWWLLGWNAYQEANAAALDLTSTLPIIREPWKLGQHYRGKN